MDKPTLDALLTAARESRKRCGPDYEYSPIILYTGKNGHEVLGMLGGDGDVADLLKETLIEIHRVTGPAEWIAFTGDTYAIYMSPEELMDKFLGDTKSAVDHLEEEFKSGVENVFEMMIVITASHTGEIEIAHQQYRYTPVDGWEWEEPVTDVEDQGGSVSIILKQFFRAQTMAGQ